MSDHSASRRADVLRREAPHLIAPEPVDAVVLRMALVALSGFLMGVVATLFVVAWVLL